MKYFFSILSMIFILSCEDEEKSIIGTWELVRIQVSNDRDKTGKLQDDVVDLFPQNLHFHFTEDTLYQLYYPFHMESKASYFIKDTTITYTPFPKYPDETETFYVDWISDTLRLWQRQYGYREKYFYFVLSEPDNEILDDLIAGNINWKVLDKEWRNSGYGRNDTLITCGLNRKVIIDLRPENELNYHFSQDTLFYRYENQEYGFEYFGGEEDNLYLIHFCDSAHCYHLLFYGVDNTPN